MTNLNSLGNEYHQEALSEEQLLKNPFQQFESWITLAIKNKEIEPNAMSLATVNRAYQVTSRMVLLKYFDEKGFVFFTNYNSTKGLALSEIPNASLLFWWPRLEKQIRIVGSVKKIDTKHSDQYFASRIKEAQCAALASEQSKPLKDKDALLACYQQLTEKHLHSPIPRPKHWGGYCLTPQSFEFWQGRPHRLHDRFLYERIQFDWKITRLSP